MIKSQHDLMEARLSHYVLRTRNVAPGGWDHGTSLVIVLRTAEEVTARLMDSRVPGTHWQVEQVVWHGEVWHVRVMSPATWLREHQGEETEREQR